MSTQKNRTPAAVRLRTFASAARSQLLRVEASLRPAGLRVEQFLSRHRPSRKQLAIGLGVLLVLFIVAWQRCGIRGCPDVGKLTAYQPGGASVLLDRNGRELGDLRPVERVIVRLDELPAHVGEAFIAIEDKRFLTHHGVDWRRAFGSLLANIKSGGFGQGFSTITMQLARNVWQERLPGQQRTLRRKLLEVRVAHDIEARFTKKEILELYLNHIYFGGGAYGIEAAAVSYFRKRARDLDMGEAALLAALPKAPNGYDPRVNPKRAIERRNLVLTAMREQGYITQNEEDGVRQADLLVAAEPALLRRSPGVAAHFIDMVRRELEGRMGDDLYSSQLTIRTTLDGTAQVAAAEELERQLEAIERGALGGFEGPRYRGAQQADSATDYLQGAVVVMDALSGDVLALVGGRDFRDSRFDRATQARRQVGSAFKPFVYATALEHGIPPTQPIADEPIQLMSNGVPWEPRNFDGEFHGIMTMREALVRSENVPTVRLAQKVGLDDIVTLARRDGITADMPKSPMLSLGTAEVSPLDLTSAYTAFASLGKRAEPRTVLTVEDRTGRTVYTSEVTRHDVLEPNVAFLLTDMLRDAVDRGTGSAVREAGYDGLAAGKTGTTTDAADAWFVGYTPEVVGGVWIGFDRRRMIAPEATGGHAAAPVWGRMMTRIYARRSRPKEWPQAAGVIRRMVDPASGLVLKEGCSPAVGRAGSEWFASEAQPNEVCPRGESKSGGSGGVFASVWRAVRNLFSRDGDTSGARVAPPASSAVERTNDEAPDAEDSLEPVTSSDEDADDGVSTGQDNGRRDGHKRKHRKRH